jgi:hypothetical protein
MWEAFTFTTFCISTLILVKSMTIWMSSTFGCNKFNTLYVIIWALCNEVHLYNHCVREFWSWHIHGSHSVCLLKPGATLTLPWHVLVRSAWHPEINGNTWYLFLPLHADVFPNLHAAAGHELRKNQWSTAVVASDHSTTRTDQTGYLYCLHCRNVVI